MQLCMKLLISDFDYCKNIIKVLADFQYHTLINRYNKISNFANKLKSGIIPIT